MKNAGSTRVRIELRSFNAQAGTIRQIDVVELRPDEAKDAQFPFLAGAAGRNVNDGIAGLQEAAIGLYPDRIVGWKVGGVPPALQPKLGPGGRGGCDRGDSGHGEPRLAWARAGCAQVTESPTIPLLSALDGGRSSE